ncbi:hypothetical protein XA67_24240 [Comamonas thiooxydans]|nr:hypothetical protein XA67_24240 [Comamonas thiooxydans]
MVLDIDFDSRFLSGRRFVFVALVIGPTTTIKALFQAWIEPRNFSAFRQFLEPVLSVSKQRTLTCTGITHMDDGPLELMPQQSRCVCACWVVLKIHDLPLD